jgi:AcrR family transcriptional regulator
MPSETKNTSDLRRRILDEARHLLLDVGFHDLSMRKIASATGVSATSIYIYFAGKDQLLHALIEEGFEALIGELESVMAGSLSETERLSLFMQAYFRFSFRQPEYYELMFSIRPDQMERYPAEKFRRARYGIELTAQLLRQGVQAGRFTIEDCTRTAWFVWSSLHGAVSLVKARRLDVRIPVSDFLYTAMQSILMMIGCREAVLPVSFEHEFSERSGQSVSVP